MAEESSTPVPGKELKKLPHRKIIRTVSVADDQRDEIGRYLPGQSTFSKGRPAGPVPLYSSFYQCLQRVASHKASGWGGLTVREVVCGQVARLAALGVPWAVQFYVERLEGKAHAQIDVVQSRSPLSDLSDEELDRVLKAAKEPILVKDQPIPAEIDKKPE